MLLRFTSLVLLVGAGASALSYLYQYVEVEPGGLTLNFQGLPFWYYMTYSTPQSGLVSSFDVISLTIDFLFWTALTFGGVLALNWILRRRGGSTEVEDDEGA